MSCIVRRASPFAHSASYCGRVSSWTFFTNHAHVLLCVARDPGIRHRDVALHVGITERATQRIMADLVEAGYLARERDGRRNRYRVNPNLPLRHPLEQDHRIGEVLAVLNDEPGARPAPAPPEGPAA